MTRTFGLIVATAVVASSLTAPAALAETPGARDSAGLDRVNEHRALAGLPAVTEDAGWATGLTNHSRYMVENNLVGHSEALSNPWYTPDGDAAAAVAVLVAGITPIDAEATIDLWMTDPLRAITIIDSQLTKAAYGSYHDAGSIGLKSAAGLDVQRGVDSLASASYPVMWPGNGSVSSLTTMTGGVTNLLQPLHNCAGYNAPSGAPIYVQVGDGSVTPSVTGSTLTSDGVPVEHCIFDETTWDAPNSAELEGGRAILDSRDAIVIIPRHPLTDGATYCASVTVDGVAHEWAFAIGSGPVVPCEVAALPLPLVTVGLVDDSRGEWHLRNSGGSITSFFYGNPGDFPIMGDWDCNGTDTPGMYRQSDGFVYLKNANAAGNADRQFFLGNPGDVPLAGDFNADGCDTVSIYRPAEQRFYISNTLAADNAGISADFSFLFGNPGDKPVTGDWDADGVTEIGLHRETTGFFYWRNTLDTGNATDEIFFGDPGDRFVAGDWGSVDGIDTPAVFRPTGATFFFRHTLTQGNADSQFAMGESPWLPVSGAFGLG